MSALTDGAPPGMIYALSQLMQDIRTAFLGGSDMMTNLTNMGSERSEQQDQMLMRGLIPEAL
jgi:hypothetical protein